MSTLENQILFPFIVLYRCDSVNHKLVRIERRLGENKEWILSKFHGIKSDIMVGGQFSKYLKKKRLRH